MTSRILSTVLVLCLTFGAALITGCDHPTASDATKSADAPAMRAEIRLQADPNPILKGNPDGTTTITWDTAGNDVGEVYVMEGEKEKLLATGAKGSQEATGLKPGVTEFRLYNQAGHKLLAQIKVTVSPPEVPPTKLSLKPASSPTP